MHLQQRFVICCPSQCWLAAANLLGTSSPDVKPDLQLAVNTALQGAAAELALRVEKDAASSAIPCTVTSPCMQFCYTSMGALPKGQHACTAVMQDRGSTCVAADSRTCDWLMAGRMSDRSGTYDWSTCPSSETSCANHVRCLPGWLLLVEGASLRFCPFAWGLVKLMSPM